MKIVYKTTGKVYGLVESQDDLNYLMKCVGKTAKIVSKPKRAYKKRNGRKAWSKKEEQRLAEVMSTGVNKSKQIQLSRELKRTQHAIRIRWDRIKSNYISDEMGVPIRIS